MNETRVKGKNIEIPSKDVLDFIEKRTQQFNDKHPLTAILYQDKNPELAEQRDIEEKKIILPQLSLTGQENVLDIGCGIGRWAITLAPSIKNYVGIDASNGLIRRAKSLVHAPNVSFFCINAHKLKSSKTIQKKQPFNLFIITGLFIYLNDSQLKDVLEGISSCIANDNATIYIREPFSIKNERLTLNNFWSEELSAQYSAIYRTQEEFIKLWQSTSLNLHFKPPRFLPLFEDVKLNNRTETRQMYCVLKKEAKKGVKS